VIDALPTIERAGQLLRRRDASSIELTAACLGVIAERGAGLGAFITVTAEAARLAAATADRELAAGQDRGPLHGIPGRAQGSLRSGGRDHDGRIGAAQEQHRRA